MSELDPPFGARTNIGSLRSYGCAIRADGSNVVADNPILWDHTTVVSQRSEIRLMGSETLTLSQLEARIIERKKNMEEMFGVERARCMPDNFDFLAMVLSRAEGVKTSAMKLRGIAAEDAAKEGAAKGQELLELRAKREDTLNAATGLQVFSEALRVLTGKPRKATRPFRQFSR